MAVFYDQLNRAVNLPSTPKRIISVVPSQTELLFYLGLNDEVVGITKFCIHPADKFTSKTKVGGTKQLNIGLIKELQPDLIIANKEENEQAQIEGLMTICPVWVSDISNLNEALDMIIKVGEVIGKQNQALVLANAISKQFDLFKPANLNLRVAYLIWRGPYMVAGQQTFINSLLQKCGLINVFDDDRYPEVSAQQLTAAQPDVIILSSEPYPFNKKHIDEFNALLPNAKVILVDGEMFSWYGNRLLYAPAYFKTLLAQLN